MTKRISVEQMPEVKNEEQKRHLVRYVNFINSRPERDLHQKGFHTHHIYPKSLAKKNNIDDFNGDWNLIELTPREHFIAHMILWKCGYREMAFAYKYMTKINEKNGVKISSKKYEKICSTLSHSEKTKEKMSIASKGIPKSEKHKQSLSKSKLNKPTKYWKGKNFSKEHKEKLSISHGGDGFLKVKKTAEEIETSRLKTLESFKRGLLKQSIYRSGKTYEEIFGDKAKKIKDLQSKARKGKSYEEIYKNVETLTMVKEKQAEARKKRWQKNHFNCKVEYDDKSTVIFEDVTITSLEEKIGVTRKNIKKLLSGLQASYCKKQTIKVISIIKLDNCVDI